MARVKGAMMTRKRRNKVLKLAKGYWGAKSKHFKMANQAVMKSLTYAYTGRRLKKRDFRQLWITRINAGCKMNGMNYSTFMNGLKKAGVDINRKVLTFVPAKDGKYFYLHEDKYWRIMVYIPDTVSQSGVTPESSYIVGETFGNFQAMLADIPVSLGETIKDFHNMEFRLQQLREAVAENKAGRLAEVQWLVDELEKRADEMCKGERLHRQGELPKRICHCDTKVDNILFDQAGNVLCVIDLDTVMPNYIFSDFGDFLRSAANTGDEDDKNLDNVNFNMSIFKAFTEGYLKSARCFLTPIEIENLPYAACLFPYMQTVRFLADYINGDTYYKIQYPEHNLVRSKAQFKLLQSAEAAMPEMKAFIAEQLG